MADVSIRSFDIAVPETEKSHDFAILLSVGAVAIGLVVMVWAKADTSAFDPSNLVSMFPLY